MTAPIEAYEAGVVTFLGLELFAARGALVPRPETELLAEAALTALASVAAPRVIDMCCGSGNLACALAVRLPSAEVWAADLTEPTVQLTARNADKLGVGARVHVAQSDLFAALTGLGLEGSIDAVVCNPPYISTGRLEKDRHELLAHEPREAFDGGPYGLSIHQRVMQAALAFLRPGGSLLLELGAGQDRQIRLLFDRVKGYEAVTFHDDASGVARVVTAKKTG